MLDSPAVGGFGCLCPGTPLFCEWWGEIEMRFDIDDMNKGLWFGGSQC